MKTKQKQEAEMDRDILYDIDVDLFIDDEEQEGEDNGYCEQYEEDDEGDVYDDESYYDWGD